MPKVQDGLAEGQEEKVEALQKHFFPQGIKHDWLVVSQKDWRIDSVCRRCGVEKNPAGEDGCPRYNESDPCTAWRPDLRIEDAMLLVKRLKETVKDFGFWTFSRGREGDKWECSMEFGYNGKYHDSVADTPAMAITLAAWAALEAK